MANVSVTTVSKVFNNRDMNISEATKNRILTIAAENNYVPNMMAKGLKANRTNTLGIILPDITNPFFATVARGIEDAAQTKGFGVVFCDTDNNPQRERTSLAYLTSRMIDGIIFTQTLNPTSVEFLPKEIPLVVIDRLANLENMTSPKIGKVYTDTLRAIAAMTALQIQAGCKNLAYISATPTSPLDRYYGYEQALKEHHLPLRKEMIFLGDFGTETGYNGVEYLIEKGEPFDGIVCGNDLIAVGAMDALRKHNIGVPDEVKITGLDDIMIARYLTPPLTTAKQSAYDMGKSAADMLIDNLVNQTPLTEMKYGFEVIQRSTV